ncbi:MAG TPA: hypothetical protein DCY31_06410 [Ruminococcaceae bacterium]|nr:hypothetical protein [Oscillospiraceae bacterium]
MKTTKDANGTKRGNLRLKIEFYILSLWLLFALIFLLTVDIPITFAPDAKFIGIIPLIQRNWLAIISILMALAGVVIMFKLKHRFEGVHYPPAEITNIKNENYEYLTFLTTYIIPLICINLDEIRYVIVLGILLLIIGSIFVKTDLYLGNPTLALLGYHLYRIEAKGFSSTDGILVISQDKLTVGSSIKWIKITDSVWVAKEHK